jgi:uncharacterized membrane protein YbaN (DUF454 family)
MAEAEALDRDPQVPLPAVVAPVSAGHSLLRPLLLLLALVSLLLAVLGAILPGLPSTEFVLLAAWAAARSSPRFHAWLLRHRLFGPLLRNWQDGRRVSRRAKWAASGSMLACSVVLIAHSPPLWLLCCGLGCMATVLLWLWRRPEPACAAG